MIDKTGNVIGQLGHLDFLVALEPKYSLIGNLDLMSRSGLSPDFLDQMNENFSLFTEGFDNMLRRSAQVKVKHVMRPLRESIEEDAPITDAVHKMVMWQTMRMLVTRQGKAVGILRLVEVFREVSERMRALQEN